MNFIFFEKMDCSRCNQNQGVHSQKKYLFCNDCQNAFLLFEPIIKVKNSIDKISKMAINDVNAACELKLLKEEKIGSLNRVLDILIDEFNNN